MAGQLPDCVPLQPHLWHGHDALRSEQVHGDRAAGVVLAVSRELQELYRVHFLYQLVECARRRGSRWID